MSTLSRIFGWLYTQMLRLYPQDFRVNFGAEMQAVFTKRLVDRSGFGPSIQVFLLELQDLPGALLQQYRQQPVWALSAAGSLPSESGQLEARLRHKSHRGQFFCLLKAALFVVLFVIAVYIHGYLFTAHLIHQSVQEFGTYPTLDEAIQSLDQHYEQYYRNIESISISTQGPIKAEYDFIWELRIDVFAESLADGRSINQPSMTKIYYIHTKDGWVPYENEIWVEVGFLPHWIKFYHLYGEGV